MAISLVGWVAYCRIVRGQVLVAKEQEYALAARASGLPTWRILFRHLLPNVVLQAIVYSMSDIVLTILAIVTLGYLGLGVPPPTPDWGTMIAGGPGLPDHPVVPDHHSRPLRRARRPLPRAGRRRPRPAERDADEHPAARGPRPPRRDPAAARPLHAVRGVSLSADAGESVGLVGESGSGKSITLRALLGLLPAPARIIGGSILLDGGT